MTKTAARRIPPLFAWAFLSLGIVLLLVSLLPGNAAAALLRRFQHGGGDLAVLFTQKTVPALRLGGTALLAAGAASLWLRTNIENIFTRLAGWITRLDARQEKQGHSPADLAVWLALCAAAILATAGGVIAHGYFQFDDFEVLEVARIHSLWDSLFIIHGDHTMPLFRLELGLTRKLFGIQALYFNLLLLALFTTLIYFGLRLLMACGAGALALAMFVVLMAGSILWSEFLGGYYMISTFPQQLLLSFIACWAFVRWQQSGRVFFQAVLAVSLLAAPMMDLSGFWVLPAVLVFVFCRLIGSGLTPHGWRNGLRANLWLLLLFGLVTLAALLFVFYVFTTAPPGAFLSMAQSDKPSLPQMLGEVWYFLTAGILMSPVFPVGYWKLPVFLLVTLMMLFSAGAIVLAVWGWRRTPRVLRWTLLSAFLIILINAVLVARGRPQPGFDYRWPAKYIGSAYAWLVLILCLGLQQIWARATLPARAALLQLGLMGALFFITIQTASGLAAGGFSNGAFGMHAMLADAQIRRQGVSALRQAIAPLFGDRKVPALPMLTGKFIGAQDISLLRYDMNCYGDFLVPPGHDWRLVQNKAMRLDSSRTRDTCSVMPTGRDGVQTVPSLRAAIDPAFLQILKTSPEARKYYMAGVPLDTTPVSCPSGSAPPLRPREGVTLGGGWDPQARHVLILDVRYDGGEPAGRLLLSYGGDFGAQPPVWIDVPAGKHLCLSADMLQLYSYALSTRVTDIKAEAQTAGRWHVAAAFAP